MQENLLINALRMLAVDQVEAAGSGHPGMPLGAAPMAYVLFQDFLKFNPIDPTWPDRDRFVLSAGHGSALLYALLHLYGYSLPLEELKKFRQLGSLTPGHPEYGLTVGVETTTGPLGQGLATAIGLAAGERHLAARFNREGLDLVDHRTYVIASDGDLMEGIQAEAASLAGHWGLGKLTVLYDDNHISIDGPTELAFSEDVLARYAAYGWQTLRVADGNDLAALRRALSIATNQAEKPTLIAVRTHIGYGSELENQAESHGAPLGPERVATLRRKLDWPYPAFEIPAEIRGSFAAAGQRGKELQAAWNALVGQYQEQFPEVFGEWQRHLSGQLPAYRLPEFKTGEKIATRAASGKTLAALAPVLPELVGGSADLTPSNNTFPGGVSDFSKTNPAGRYFRFGVREHAMTAILNGLALQGLRPYGGTFLIFSDYLKPALRVAALSGFPIILVFSHDSVALGEDGPTHQPIEQLAALRSIPNLWVIRPADASETAIAWDIALRRPDGPVALILTRQALPVLDRSQYGAAQGIERGGYVVREAPDAVGTIIATGSEVSLALAATEILDSEGLPFQVVNLASWEIFAQQDRDYQAQVLPDLPTLSLEAAATFGWERYADRAYGIDSFGASGPGGAVYQSFGFTPEAVASACREILG